MSTIDIFDRFADSESYFTADREIGALFGGASFAATQVSAGTLVGAVGLHYVFGLGFMWTWVGIWAGWILSMIAIAPRLRAEGGYTVPDFLDARFGSEPGCIRGLSGGLIAVIYLVYTTAQYVAGAVVLETLLGTSQLIGAAVIAVLTLSYTVVGGMRSSIYTDVLQVVILVGGIVLAAAVGLADLGGPGVLAVKVAAADPSLLDPFEIPSVAVGLALSFGLGMTIAPYELSRVYAMRDPETVRRAIPVSIAIQVVIAVCIAVLGLLAVVQFPELATPDAAVTQLALELFGPLVGVILLLGVLAAILSTVDSILLVTASAVAHDLYAETLPALGVITPPDETSVVRIAQATTVVGALVPLALVDISGLLGGLVQFIVALYTSLLAATLFVPVVAGLHWSSTTSEGAVSGMIAGLCAVVVWQVLSESTGLITAVGGIDPVVPGVLISALTTVTVSLLTRSKIANDS